MALMTWFSCLFSDVIVGFVKGTTADPIPVLCFLGGVATSFVAGAVYGHEAEYERAQRGQELKEQDLECQPLLDSGMDEKDYFLECYVEHIE